MISGHSSCIFVPTEWIFIGYPMTGLVSFLISIFTRDLYHSEIKSSSCLVLYFLFQMLNVKCIIKHAVMTSILITCSWINLMTCLTFCVVFQEWQQWMVTASLAESTDPNAIIIVNYPMLVILICYRKSYKYLIMKNNLNSKRNVVK